MAEDTEHPVSASSDEDPGEHLPLVELETLLNQPPSRRRRLIQLGLGLVAMALVLVTFWGVFWPKAPPGPTLHALPTETPPTLVITSNVNYGTITINGQKQRGTLPLKVKMHTPPPYQITLDAPPFQSYTCTFPGCNGLSHASNDPTAFPINLAFYPTGLPADQQSQVAALVSQAIALQQEMDVPEGALIASQLAPDGTIISQQATEPLHATALFFSDIPVNRYGVGCSGVVCVDNFTPIGSTSSGSLWQVSSFVALRWRFTTAAGDVVAEVPYPVDDELLIALAYDPATGWQFARQSLSLPGTDELTNDTCRTGAEMLMVEQARYLSGGGWSAEIAGKQGIEGCEIRLMQNNSFQGQFVWRFGVLLAEDQMAHNTLPNLPVASPDDIAAVAG